MFLRKFTQFLLLFLWSSHVAQAQVTCIPVFPSTNDDVTITFHADQGNAALANFNGNVYAHTGVITTASTGPTDWKYVQTTWGTNDAKGLMTKTGTNTYTKSFNIRAFYNVPAGEQVLRLAFVFRNQAGTVVGRAADGSDIYYDVQGQNAPLRTFFQAPNNEAVFTTIGGTIPVQAAASKPSSLQLFDNGNLIASANNASALQHNISVTTGGTHRVVLRATAGVETDSAVFVYLIPQNPSPQDLPAGTRLGVNYLNGSSVRVVLDAPGKSSVFVLGDFNNWLPDTDLQLRPTTDGRRWWADISGLTPGQEYGYQFLVDGQRIADPLATKILDPWNDQYIPAITYPNLKPYPTGRTSGFVSVMQPGKPDFPWEVTNFQKPAVTKLVIYELLMRDFIARHDYETLLDTLDYLQNLGVTAIEFMPLQEFDGNESWGYNPSFHNALDKYYGTPEAFKRVVDECHKRGIAVIVDVVYNHVTGASPLASLWWDSANNRPAANSPYLNPTAKHDFNVFNDMNHESISTQDYVKHCLRYWLEEYHVDGYRFDLSKGFTQKNTLGNISAWGALDQNRVNLLKSYADFMWAIDPDSYVILEHLADNAEEKILAEYGMMLWGNSNYAYKEVAIGFGGTTTQSLYNTSHKSRNWSKPHLVSYMESHDEERLMYECLTFGNSSLPNYNVKNLKTALGRIEALSNLFYAVPGPKMLWQFGEQGYDYSINYCPNGTISPNCRIANKPIRWDYLQNTDRRHLRDMTAAIMHLRKVEPSLTSTDDYSLFISTGIGRWISIKSPEINALVASNVGTGGSTFNVTFPKTGTWYEYYTGQTLVVNTTSTKIALPAGGYRLYLDKFVPLPPGIDLTSSTDYQANPAVEGLRSYPNPTSGELYLDFDLVENAELEISLSDLSGRMVRTWASESFAAGHQNHALHLHHIPSGLYFLNIRDNATGRINVKKVVISRD